MKVLVVNGPNLNMLGQRETEIYGKVSLKDIQKSMSLRAFALGLEIISFQSNCEGHIVKVIHNALHGMSGLIINPAGYTHTSIAIRDAILLLNIPVIEVHLSNIYARESFRKTSRIADIVTGQISGLGAYGYILALEAIFELCK